MKKIISLITAVLITVSIMAALLPAPVIKAEAAAKASALLKASETEIRKGDSVKITLTVTSGLEMGIFKYELTYDSDKLTFIPSKNQDPSYGTIKERVDTQEGSELTSFQREFNFTATDVGTVTFKLTNVLNISLESVEQIETETSDVTVKITDKAKSNNCRLKSIEPSVGKLEPAFSPDVTKYKVAVPAGTKVCYLDCVKEDSSASRDLSGDEYLKVGDNVRTCTVTAADGTVKVYTITVVRPADPTEKPTATPEATPNPSTTPLETPSGETKNPDSTELPEQTPEIPEETVIGNVTIGEDTFMLYDIKNDLQNAHRELTITKSSNFLYGTTILSGLRCYLSGSNTQYLVKASKNGGTTQYYVFDTADKTVQRYGGTEEQLLKSFDIVEGEFIKPTDSEVVPGKTPAPEVTPSPTETTNSSDTVNAKPVDNKVFLGVGIGIIVIFIAMAVAVIVNMSKK